MIHPQFILPIASELVIDLFAGGGGASTGIELAIGRHVDIAINHDPEAVSLHEANHPQTRHFVSDVFEVDPLVVTDGQPVGMLWASPDCKHFSKAKGGKPVSKKIRALAGVVIKWVEALKPTNRHPKMIFLENVEEFQTWGPLIKRKVSITNLDGSTSEIWAEYPCPKRKGQTFKRWKRSLENLGYTIEHRELRACDYGAPTIRKRLFLIARRDGMPIVWPEPTHAAPGSLAIKARKLKPWRTAADCIDWSIQAPSIFERKRALADATNRRIAKGIQRYVMEAKQPFIVNTANSKTTGRGPNVWPVEEPLRTVTSSNGHALAEPTVAPFLTEHANASTQRTFAPDEPLRTQMAQVKGGHFALASAFLAKHYTGVVGSDLADPVATVTSVDHNSLVTAHITKFNTGSTGFAADTPMHTVTAGGEQARPGTAITQGVVTATLVHYNADKRDSDVRASDVREPVKTQTTENRHGLVTANLIHMGHGEGADGTKRFSHGIRDVEQPLNTITAQGAAAGLVAGHMLKLRGDNVGSASTDPLHTVSAQGTHHVEVRAFLIKYYGTDQDPQLKEPLHTVTTKDRFGAVTVHAVPLNLTPQELANAHQVALFMRAHGYDYGDLVLVTIADIEYVIVDIGLRMLTPRELYRAQGFPESYRIDHGADGRPLTKTAQVRMCGNSVCPPLAQAIVAANYQESQSLRRAA